MPIYLLVLASILVLATAASIVFYLRSSFKLLSLVSANAALWQKLGCPERVWIDGPDSCVVTIKPLLPWLRWILAGNATGLDRDLAALLASTRKLLLAGLLLFVLTSVTIAALVFTSLHAPI